MHSFHVQHFAVVYLCFSKSTLAPMASKFQARCRCRVQEIYIINAGKSWGRLSIKGTEHDRPVGGIECMP